MKKCVKKSIGLMLVASMTVSSLTGCGSTAEESKDTTSKNNVEKTDNSKTSNVEEILTNKMDTSKDSEKKESVYVEMDAEGNVTKTTVSDELKVSGSENITDYSNLSDIKNLSGDEKFTKSDDGKIVWENKGENISYQGTTTEATPINVKVTYYLDGKKISPSDLAGKSGEVKIVYNYSNTAKTEDGQFVPFLALTGMVLDDNFSNVKVDNGKVVSYDDSNIVIGYAAPGLKDHLLNTINNAEDYIKDADIPEEVTVTADVKDFSMNMTLTVASSDMGDMNLKDTLDLSDVQKQMDELQDGANDLVDGAKQLNDGTTKLKTGSKKIDEGAKDLSKYTLQLSNGTKEMATQYTVFNKALLAGVKSAKSGADKLYAGTKSIKTATGTLDTGAKGLKKGIADAKSGSSQISSGLKSAKAAFEDTKKSQGLVNGSKTLAAGTKEVSGGVDKLVDTLKDTPDSIQKSIDDVIANVSKASGGAIASEKALNTTVEAINNAVTGGMELSQVLAANNLNTKTYYSLVQAYYSVQTLEQVKTQFTKQIATSASDIKKLTDGMDALKTGSSALSTGIGTLYAGIKQLSTGADSLDSGMSQLKTGSTSLAEGTGKLKTGASDLNDGMKTLSEGAGTLSKKIGDASPKIKAGIGTIDTAASQISDGAKTLASGTTELKDGIVTLADGTKELKDGTIKLNDEGISKITKTFKEDAPDAIDKIQETLNNGKKYNSFSGIDKNMSGNVKFILKVQEISNDK
ncbi:hypothetical protein [Eubacterium ventriosum]|uniref:hypothetical protein n=1 Tax=Eubacterium ventriosum TaxID=39496 RepID=UPI0026702533|nr:hypothetical protein [Eubacterium ventriosum]